MRSSAVTLTVDSPSQLGKPWKPGKSIPQLKTKETLEESRCLRHANLLFAYNFATVNSHFLPEHAAPQSLANIFDVVLSEAVDESFLLFLLRLSLDVNFAIDWKLFGFIKAILVNI